MVTGKFGLYIFLTTNKQPVRTIISQYFMLINGRTISIITSSVT